MGIKGISTPGPQSKDAASHKDDVTSDNELSFTANPAEIATDAFEAAKQVGETINDALTNFFSNSGDALGRMAMRLKDSAPKLIETGKIPEGLTAGEFSNSNVAGLLAARPAKSYPESVKDNALLRLFRDIDEMNIGTGASDEEIG